MELTLKSAGFIGVLMYYENLFCKCYGAFGTNLAQLMLDVVLFWQFLFFIGLFFESHFIIRGSFHPEILCCLFGES
jgi:hypothetical protein